MSIQQLSDRVLGAVAEDAMNKAFLVMQNRLGVESGDFASSWVMPHEIKKFKSWLIAYAHAEMNFDLEEQRRVARKEKWSKYLEGVMNNE